MSTITFACNGESRSVRADPETPLLWVLRENLGLTGTKLGCGRGLCGACTVHLDGSAARACTLPVASVRGRSVTTVEGLEGPVAAALRSSWARERVPQCGYCQAGQLMAADALLRALPSPSAAAVRSGLAGNLCRCGTYARIRRAVLGAAQALVEG